MAVTGMYIVQGEMTQVVTALRRSRRWTSGAGGNAVVSSMSGNHPASLDDQDPLLRCFADLRDVLSIVSDLADIHSADFLSPFLEVIRSEQTSGPVTGLALSAVGKFLAYGLVDPLAPTAPSAVEQIADAVTHARFVGTDHGSDEVVLLKILNVLRTLLLTPVGSLLTNESVCEILQSCFRICFETRLSELLRRAGESTLSDMIQLLFTRLPTFCEDPRDPYVRKLATKAANAFADPMLIKRKKKYKRHRDKPPKPPFAAEGNKTTGATDASELGEETPVRGNEILQDTCDMAAANNETVNQGGLSDSEKILETHDEADEVVTPPTTLDVACSSPTRSRVVDVHGGLLASPDEVASDDDAKPESDMCLSIKESELVTGDSAPGLVSINSDEDFSKYTGKPEEELIKEADEPGHESDGGKNAGDDKSHASETEEDPATFMKPKKRVNRHGVTFFADKSSNKFGKQGSSADFDGAVPLKPYGLPCIRELFRFLISLSNPGDSQNTEAMIQMGLNLLTVALESGVDYLGDYGLLMPLVKNELSKNLLQLIQTDRLPLFAGALRACFLLFESLRTHLKFQLEMYLTKLMDLVVSENPKISFELKEMALEALVQLWRVPGLVTELYLNYDCDLYCSNLFEDLTKLLSKNSFPVAGIYSTHVLSLDALLTVVETIEGNCHYRTMTVMDSSRHLKASSARQPPGKHFSVGSNLPPASGYTAGRRFSSSEAPFDDQKNKLEQPSVATNHHQVRPNRLACKTSSLPSHEDLIVRKKRKRILATGTDLFNQSPGKGIKFMQEHGLLETPLCAAEVVEWLKENPRLNKAAIGDYISNKKNSQVLEAYVKSFKFEGVRIDDALRAFLETFRLPGEAPVISMIMEHFAEHFHTSNDEPFCNNDAAFTLAFGIIMLNVDQHNLNAKKQNVPMTAEQFKKNLSKVNGGEDFDEELLEDIYHAIKSEEIVMPAEQSGSLRENYNWKVLLKRSATKDGRFMHAPSGIFDHDLFSLIWGPTIAAISFVFDKSQDDDDVLAKKALGGFRKCAAIAAHYGMSDVFDNLIISLCKFSTLMASVGSRDDQLGIGGLVGGMPPRPGLDPVQAMAIAFGSNVKAQQAARNMFHLVHLHGDILREGWKNILECLCNLFRARLLPTSLTEAEDYVDPKGWISILPPSNLSLNSRKDEALSSGIFSSLYSSLIGSGSDGREGKGPTEEEMVKVQTTQRVIDECYLHQIITDSRYLTSEALSEFFKALMTVSNGSLSADEQPLQPYTTVFLLEAMVNVALENKDRLAPFWTQIKGHLHRLLTCPAAGGESSPEGSTSSLTPGDQLLVERAIVNLLRLVGRLLFREELAEEMVKSLSLLLLLPTRAVMLHSQHLSYGLHALLRGNAANIHSKKDWQLMFLLLKAAGSGCFPASDWSGHGGNSVTIAGKARDTLTVSSQSHQDLSHSDAECSDSVHLGGRRGLANNAGRDSSLDRGYTSDTELYDVAKKGGAGAAGGAGNKVSGKGGNMTSSMVMTGGSSISESEWEHVGQDGELMSLKGALLPFNPNSLLLSSDLHYHSPPAFIKSCETLAFLVRDAAHITPANFHSCIDCLKTFVEASFNGGKYRRKRRIEPNAANGKAGADRSRRRKGVKNKHHGPTNEDEEAEDATMVADLTENYNQISLQLLDLTHTLHVKAADIYDSWARAGTLGDAAGGEMELSAEALWTKCWCPLLQTLARSCTDRRKQIRTTALTYLQRALLMHDLQRLSSLHWEDCFVSVLFPLLARLQDNPLLANPGGAGQVPLDPIGVEEARCRALALLCKVFLQHLTPLVSLANFTALWGTVMEFMRTFYTGLDQHSSDMLLEAIPESLKNMLLVMDTAGLFGMDPNLFHTTQERLAPFLPHLLGELFPGGVKSFNGETPAGFVQSSPRQASGLLNSDGQWETRQCDGASGAALTTSEYSIPENNYSNDASYPEHSEVTLEEVVVKPPIYIPEPEASLPKVAAAVAPAGDFTADSENHPLAPSRDGQLTAEAAVSSAPVFPLQIHEENVAGYGMDAHERQAQTSYNDPSLMRSSQTAPTPPVFSHENPIFSASSVGGVILHPPSNSNLSNYFVTSRTTDTSASGGGSYHRGVGGGGSPPIHHHYTPHHSTVSGQVGHAPVSASLLPDPSAPLQYHHTAELPSFGLVPPVSSCSEKNNNGQ